MKSDLQEKLLSNVDKDDDHSGEELNFKKVFNNEYNNGARESEQYYLKHCISVEHLAQVFKADLVNGLKTTDKADLEWREKKWGNNHLPPEEENSILQHIIDCFEDPTLKVLVVAAIVSLIIGLLKDGISSGRNVYDCIRKFIQFQLTTNIVAVFMTFLGGIILKDSPLNAIEMLWVNLIMDSFASLALATESPTNELLNRQPYKSNSNILTPMMTLTIIAQALFQIACLTVILFYGDVMFGVPSDRELEHFTWNNVNGYHFTIFFNIFVFMQVFNSINARKLNRTDYNVFKGILGNWYYIFIQSFIIVGQMIMVTFGGRAVRTHALSLMQHLQCLGIASLTLIIGFLIKFIPIDTTETVVELDKEGKSRSRSKSGFGYSSRGGMKLNTNSLGKSQNRI